MSARNSKWWLPWAKAFCDLKIVPRASAAEKASQIIKQVQGRASLGTELRASL